MASSLRTVLYAEVGLCMSTPACSSAALGGRGGTSGRMSHFSKVTPKGRNCAGFIEGERKSGVGLGEQTFLRGS